MPKSKKMGKGQKLVASSNQVEIKQQSDAPKRYTSALAPASETEIRQTVDATDIRY